MGGDEPARTLIAAALAAGKAVVTANKHVIAHHGPELEAIARRTGAALRFEAAVGGGHPGPRAARRRARREPGRPRPGHRQRHDELHPDRRWPTRAGPTTRSWPPRRPPATPRPTRRATSRATTRSTSSSSSSGSRSATWVDPAEVVRRPPTGRAGGLGRPGITGVTAADIAGAAALGATIKLVADAPPARRPDRAPRSCRPSCPSPTRSAGRTASRTGSRSGPSRSATSRSSGPGAGGGATSSAVLGDLLAIARGIGSTWAGPAAGRSGAGAGRSTGRRSEAPDRGWFAIVPGDVASRRRGRPRTCAPRPSPGGTAVILRGVSLAAARSLFRAAGLPRGRHDPAGGRLAPRLTGSAARRPSGRERGHVQSRDDPERAVRAAPRARDSSSATGASCR